MTFTFVLSVLVVFIGLHVGYIIICTGTLLPFFVVAETRSR